MKNTFLHDKLTEERCSIIKTTADGKMHSDNLRKVVYFCTAKNVAIEKLQEVMSFILKNLAAIRAAGTTGPVVEWSKK